MAAILFIKMRPKFGTVIFIAINILCKFGEDTFINEKDNVKVLKNGCTPTHTEGVL